MLAIDEHRLDRECCQLPSQYRQVAFAAAQTAQNIDELKAELRVIEAEIHLRIRSNPLEHGLEKITEGAINEVTSLNPKFLALEKKIRILEKNLAMEKILVFAMDYKKRALTNLVDLHVAGWFAQVRPTEERRSALKPISVNRSPAIKYPVKSYTEEKIARKHKQDDHNDGE